MKIEKLQADLKEYEMFFVTSEASRQYLTGFESSDGFLCVTKDRAVFFTDGRYFEDAQREVRNCETVLYKGMKNIIDFANENAIKKIDTERERVTVAEFERYKKIFENIEVTADGELDEILKLSRGIKDEEEIKLIKTAQSISEKALDEVLKFIKAGVTEREISSVIEYSMRKNGGDGAAFDTIALCGKSTSVPHGVPGDRKVCNGDFVTMDFGCVYKGYRSDMTRTVAVGTVSDRQKNVYETVLKAQLGAINRIKAGEKCSQIDKTARDIISKAGYGDFFSHSFGHGVGIEIHEYPNLSPKSEAVLEIGNVVTAEPGIYLPGEFGVRIEDFGTVTADGFENFTKAEKELIVLR